MTEQQKTKRLSSPQGLGAPPVNPEGEDSLRNLPKFVGEWKMVIWIMTDIKALITLRYWEHQLKTMRLI